MKNQKVEIEPVLSSVRIYNDGSGCYLFSIRHEGGFRLQDYDELELEVKSARFVARE